MTARPVLHQLTANGLFFSAFWNLGVLTKASNRRSSAQTQPNLQLMSLASQLVDRLLRLRIVILSTLKFCPVGLTWLFWDSPAFRSLISCLASLDLLRTTYLTLSGVCAVWTLSPAGAADVNTLAVRSLWSAHKRWSIWLTWTCWVQHPSSLADVDEHLLSSGDVLLYYLDGDVLEMLVSGWFSHNFPEWIPADLDEGVLLGYTAPRSQIPSPVGCRLLASTREGSWDDRASSPASEALNAQGASRVMRIVQKHKTNTASISAQLSNKFKSSLQEPETVSSVR
ncbi:hypothetical protein Nepgr_003860 [Nepenthes gracilis]|uniref:Uncharacterized protein n=1 Tax=Nepenthes gracilis TaxID=150966 RepID=A0AAD3S0A9_NEPGR|nr:hypothetical protein Nepgr_003860 [Nepenthes gracilis]